MFTIIFVDYMLISIGQSVQSYTDAPQTRREVDTVIKKKKSIYIS